MLNERYIGRPPLEIDMQSVYPLLASHSIRQIAKRIGVKPSTLSRRVQQERQGHLLPVNSNPFCVTDRVRMARITQRGRKYFRCRLCGTSTIFRPALPKRPPNHRIGRPPKFDYGKASEMLQKLPVIDVAKILGVNRNTLYHHIAKSQVEGRPFRTWTLRHERSVVALYWPYMEANDPRYDGVIKLVNEAVPRTFDDMVRADICQDLVASVLMGEVNIDQIKAAVKQHVSRHYKQFPVRDFRTISLDAPLRSNTNGDEDRRIIDAIDHETYQDRMTTLRYNDLLSDSPSVDGLAERLADRWKANRLIKDRVSNGGRKTFRKPSERPTYIDTERDRLSRKYKLIKGRVYSFPDYSYRGSFGSSWSIETALPEELREPST